MLSSCTIYLYSSFPETGLAFPMCHFMDQRPIDTKYSVNLELEMLHLSYRLEQLIL